MICVCNDHPDACDVKETSLGIAILDSGIPVYYPAGDATNEKAMMTSGPFMLLSDERQFIVILSDDDSTEDCNVIDHYTELVKRIKFLC